MIDFSKKIIDDMIGNFRDLFIISLVLETHVITVKLSGSKRVIYP